MKRILVLTTVAALAATLTLAAPASAHAHHSSDGPTVVLDYLNNPRQLAVGPDGSLLVAQAGSGGTTCTGTGQDEQCNGDTASITRIRDPWSWHPHAHDVIAGLPSSAGPDGSFAIGANGVGVNDWGRVFGVVSGAPDVGTPTGNVVNTLFKVKHGQAKIIADLAAYETANDPDGQGPDSDPYSVLVQHHRILVADAAGNDVLSVDPWGNISVFHVFPNLLTGPCKDQPPEGPGRNPGCDFVPTAIANGPWGTVYVTGLAAEVPGEGRVVQLDHWGNVLHEWSGFTTPVGVVADQHGGFYVSELLANLDPTAPDPPNVGLVTHVTCKGGRSSRTVPLPAGLAIIGNHLYVSVYSIASAGGALGNPDWHGQIWRMNL